MLNALGSAALTLASGLKDGGLIVNEHTLTREETRRHVEALGRWFEFIGLDELPARLARRGRKPFCLLTFDDGKRSNAVESAPELERLGVPACFYVVTSFLDGAGPLWFDRHAALEKTLGVLPPGLSRRAVKQLPHDVLAERMERACRRYGVAPDMDDHSVAPMTWDHVRSLRKRGFGIGAHGVTHAIMTREAREGAKENIAVSLRRVSEETGEPCSTFAFPNGNYTAELARHAQRCGARTVMTAEPTWADARFPLWRLPRVQLHGCHDVGMIRLKAAVGALGLFLPSGDGTGTAYRRINRLAAEKAARRERDAASHDA